MKCITFVDAEYAGKCKQARQELFLVDRVVSWEGLRADRIPLPKSEGWSSGLSDGNATDSSMQSWFGYNDPAVKEALYETTILCQFSGRSLECIFDKITILRPLISDTKRNAVNDHDEKSPGLTGAI